jgi:hypothetical protein
MFAVPKATVKVYLNTGGKEVEAPVLTRMGRKSLLTLQTEKKNNL